jgi:hypothetical protein
MCNIKRYRSKNWHYFSKVNSSIFRSQRLNIKTVSNMIVSPGDSTVLYSERSLSGLPDIKLKNTYQQQLDSVRRSSISKMSQQKLSSEDLAFCVKTPMSRFKSRYDDSR